MTVAQLIAEFLAWTGRHRARATADFYAARLKLFSAKFGSVEAAALPPLELDAWLHEVGPSRHLAVSLTALQNWALRQRLLERPWFHKLEKPRVGRRERIPAAEELAALLQGASRAFLVIVTALCQSGARPGELCRLSIDQVHWDLALCILPDHKTARKTGQPRKIPIGRAFAATLREAIGGRTAGAVFLSPQKKPWTVDGLQTTWRRLRKRAGLAADLVPYLCRHRFATELLCAGVPLKTVADLMGHSKTTTTEIYLHRDVAQLAGDQDRVPQLPVASRQLSVENPAPSPNSPLPTDHCQSDKAA